MTPDKHRARSCRRPILSLLLLLAFTPELSSASKHSLPPDEVLKAKSVFIANRTGNQDVADGADEEFKKWGRFSIVSSRKDADLVVILSRRMTVGGAPKDVRIVLVVTRPDSDDPIWQTPPATGFHTQAGYAKEAVDKFREWVSPNDK